MAVVDPKKFTIGFDIYEMLKKGHIYTMAVDVARGINNDYSVVIVFDVTKAAIQDCCKV